MTKKTAATKRKAPTNKEHRLLREKVKGVEKPCGKRLCGGDLRAK